MSHIGALIAALCPNGVERKKLGEVGTVVRGKRFVKNDMIDSGVPCIHYGEIYTKYGISASESYSYVSMDRAKTLRFANPGDVVMASAGEAIDDIGKSVAWLGNEPVAIHDACYAFSSSLDPKFVSYYFATSMFRDEIRKYISSSKISSISTKSVASASIPVPPLPVQQEIVRILDMFTQLEAELEAELEARRKQYNYYRTALLNNDNIESRSLSDLLFSLSSGKNKSRVDRGQYPVFGSTGRIGSTDRAVYTDDAILIARVGANAGRVNAVSGAYDVSDNTLILRPTPELNIRFAFHLLTNMDLNQYALGAGQPLITGKRLKNLDVPVPSMSEQVRIAEILDKFEALVNDLSSGLPAEIAGRRKQYEYYRDKLLSFEELSS